MSFHDDKEGSGFISQIRRLSRRLSGNILAADAKDVRAYYNNANRKNIYAYDEDGQLKIGDVSLQSLAEEFGTPLYVYDVNRLVDNYHQYLGTLKHIKHFLLCYAVKANSSLAILGIFARLGAGFDVVSGGEIARCLKVGVDPNKIVFSGCGKSYDEIEYAVKSGVYCINVESGKELDRIQEAACKANVVQNVSVRVNPDLALDGHSHPSTLTGGGAHKFGVPLCQALEVYNHAKASSNLRIKGISCHLGSNIGQLEPFIEARDKLLSLADELRTELKIFVEHINLGGGFAAQIDSNMDSNVDIPQWVEKLAKPITERGLKLVLEPGRSLVADAGVLLTKVEYVKTHRKGDVSGGTSPRSGSFISSATPTSPKPASSKTFVIVDAGFNDFARTALYGSVHPILPALQKNTIPIDFKYDVCGPICETTDCFAKDMALNQKLEQGDVLIIADAGAYGSSMSSGYNTRRKAAEVLINDNKPVIITERGSYEQRFANEKVVHDLKLKTLFSVEETNESLEELAQH